MFHAGCLDLDASDFKNINLVHLFETVRYYYSLQLLVGVINASDADVQKEFTEKQSWRKDIEEWIFKDGREIKEAIG